MVIRSNMWDRARTKRNIIVPRCEQESHTHILGGTKSGKSELLKYLFVQEVLRGDRNAILIDPHGDLSQEIVKIQFLHPRHASSIIYVDTLIKDVIG